MSLRHFLIFAGWSFFTILVTGFVLLVFTYGDCFGEPDCIATTNRNFWIIIGSAFVIYWSVAIALFQRWAR